MVEEEEDYPSLPNDDNIIVHAYSHMLDAPIAEAEVKKKK